jgi:ubiquitin-like protein ATG12
MSDTTTDDTMTPAVAEAFLAAKVKVHFVAVGSAPIMKKTKFQIGADQRFATVTAFLRKMLRLQDAGNSSSLFLYCQSAFVPGPDELVGDLKASFSVRDELVIHYSLQEAWG